MLTEKQTLRNLVSIKYYIETMELMTFSEVPQGSVGHTFVQSVVPRTITSNRILPIVV